MDKNKKTELLADLLEVEPNEIVEGRELESYDSWDSMSKLSLIVLMDDECEKKLTGEQIRAFKTIGDRMDFMD